MHAETFRYVEWEPAVLWVQRSAFSTSSSRYVLPGTTCFRFLCLKVIIYEQQLRAIIAAIATLFLCYEVRLLLLIVWLCQIQASTFFVESSWLAWSIIAIRRTSAVLVLCIYVSANLLRIFGLGWNHTWSVRLVCFFALCAVIRDFLGYHLNIFQRFFFFW